VNFSTRAYCVYIYIYIYIKPLTLLPDCVRRFTSLPFKKFEAQPISLRNWAFWMSLAIRRPMGLGAEVGWILENFLQVSKF